MSDRALNNPANLETAKADLTEILRLADIGNPLAQEWLANRAAEFEHIRELAQANENDRAASVFGDTAASIDQEIGSADEEESEFTSRLLAAATKDLSGGLAFVKSLLDKTDEDGVIKLSRADEAMLGTIQIPTAGTLNALQADQIPESTPRDRILEFTGGGTAMLKVWEEGVYQLENV